MRYWNRHIVMSRRRRGPGARTVRFDRFAFGLFIIVVSLLFLFFAVSVSDSGMAVQPDKAVRAMSRTHDAVRPSLYRCLDGDCCMPQPLD